MGLKSDISYQSCSSCKSCLRYLSRIVFHIPPGVGGLGCETDIPNAERLFAPRECLFASQERLFGERERPGGAWERLRGGWECLAGQRERPGRGKGRPAGFREQPGGGWERLFPLGERLFICQIPFLGEKQSFPENNA